MLIRALLVLLVFLNVGVAAWWLGRPADSLVPPAPTSHAPELELVRASTTATDAVPAAAHEPAPLPPVPPPVAAPVPVPVAPAQREVPLPPPVEARVAAPPTREPERCLALGPFETRATAEDARVRLQPQPARVRLREADAPARAYSVILPPLADRAAAQAMVERIVQAGIKDYMIINTGPSANGVALGRYGSREAAVRRQEELHKAGFTTRLEPVGEEGPSRWWLDVALPGADPDAAALARQAGVAGAVPRDCTRLSG